MASIIREIRIRAGAAQVWEVIGDFATGPHRMAPGFVLGTRLDGDCRIVTFADGTVARERLVSTDHNARRIVYSLRGDTMRPAHNNASMQIITETTNDCRLVWTHDVLPDDLAPHLETAMTRALPIIKQTFEEGTGLPSNS